MHILPYLELNGKVISTPDVKGVNMRVAAGPDQGAPNFTMRVFTVSPGGHTPLHTHPYEHEIFFHDGDGEVEYEGKTCPVSAGYVSYVPPGAKHQIRNTGSKDLIFICVVPKGI
jgi:quercetin dioxygenase-like cupin family protein